MAFALIDELLNTRGIAIPATPPIDYKPLKGSDLRLVELQPGAWTSNVEVKIFTVSLDQNPTYEALSYVWGDPGRMRRILVDEKEHRVTENLELALRHLRAHNRTILWIDALCINQRDLDERGQQVRRMKAIYEQASRVLAWLGPENDDSALAMQRLRSLKERHKGHLRVLRNHVSWSDVELLGPLDDPQTKKTWNAIAKLYSRPWFSRAWIVQEASGPKNLLVFCGLETTDFVGLTMAFLIVQELLTLTPLEKHPSYGMIEQVRAAMDNWRQIPPFKTSRMLKELPSTGILSLLQRFRDFDATDPRDKIYTALGFQKDVPSLTADYSLSVGLVYAGLVKSYIEDKNDLDILGYCRSTDYFLGQLPCWVVDWRSTNRREPFAKYANGHRVYNASGSSKPKATFSKNMETLTLEGFQLDSILKICPSTKDAQTNKELLAIHWSILDGVYNIDDPDSKYCTGEAFLQAYHRCIVADFSAGFDFSSKTPAVDLERAIGTPVSSLKLDDVKRQAGRGFAMDWKKTGPSEQTLNEGGYKQYAEAYDCQWALTAATNGRKFFLSAKGFIGLVPEEASEGDIICVLHGGSVPYVLWSATPGESVDYQFIGECYVHGMMDGEAMVQLENRIVQVEQFSLY